MVQWHFTKLLHVLPSYSLLKILDVIEIPKYLVNLEVYLNLNPSFHQNGVFHAMQESSYHQKFSLKFFGSTVSLATDSPLIFPLGATDTTKTTKTWNAMALEIQARGSQDMKDATCKTCKTSEFVRIATYHESFFYLS